VPVFFLYCQIYKSPADMHTKLTTADGFILCCGCFALNVMACVVCSLEVVSCTASISLLMNTAGLVYLVTAAAPAPAINYSACLVNACLVCDHAFLLIMSLRKKPVLVSSRRQGFQPCWWPACVTVPISSDLVLLLVAITRVSWEGITHACITVVTMPAGSGSSCFGQAVAGGTGCKGTCCLAWPPGTHSSSCRLVLHCLQLLAVRDAQF